MSAVKTAPVQSHFSILAALKITTLAAVRATLRAKEPDVIASGTGQHLDVQDSTAIETDRLSVFDAFACKSHGITSFQRKKGDLPQ